MMREKTMSKWMLYISFFAILIGISIFSIYVYTKEASPILLSDYVIDDSQIEFSIDSFEVNDETATVQITGWALIPGVRIEVNHLQRKIWIKDTSTGQFYQITTAAVRRSDVTRMYQDGTNYDKAGFSASIDLKEFGIKNVCYEVYVCYMYNGTNMIRDTGYNFTY